jgi:hypothetical protein
MEAKLKHLELIQGVIARMAGNLFFLKGWAITLIAALFALAAKDANSKYAVVAFFPVVVFWVLDGYFLSQERQFRSLYNAVRKKGEADIDFSLDTGPYSKIPHNTWLHSIFAPTLVVFYFSLIVLMLVVIWFLR